MPRTRAPSWGYRFDARDYTGERARESAGEDDGKPCARGEWCARAERSLREDGTTCRTPARTYQAFCHADRDLIGECVSGLPALYGRLHAAVGDFLTAEVLIRAPFDSGVLLRVDVDELMRHLIWAACSWHERVAAAAPARLTAPDTQASRRAELGMRAGRLLSESCPVLAAHLDVLLGLGRDVMCRAWASWLPSVLPEAVIAGGRSGVVMVPMDGADAGNEVLKLDYLGRAALLETEPGPERLLGVPCRMCDRRTLRRASPPQHEGDREFWSDCMLCHDLLTEPEYRAWVRSNAAYWVTRVTPAQVAAGLVA